MSAGDDGWKDANQAADEKFKRAIHEIFDKLRLVPSATIASVWAGVAEDDETHFFMIETTAGGTIVVQACPGKQLAIYEQEGSDA